MHAHLSCHLTITKKLGKVGICPMKENPRLGCAPVLIPNYLQSFFLYITLPQVRGLPKIRAQQSTCRFMLTSVPFTETLIRSRGEGDTIGEKRKEGRGQGLRSSNNSGRSAVWKEVVEKPVCK